METAVPCRRNILLFMEKPELFFEVKKMIRGGRVKLPFFVLL